MSGNAQENQKHQPTKPPPETNHTTVRLIPSRNPAPVASGPNSVPNNNPPDNPHTFQAPPQRGHRTGMETAKRPSIR